MSNEEETKKQKLEDLDTKDRFGEWDGENSTCAFVLDFWNYGSEDSTFVNITDCEGESQSIEGKPAYKNFTDAYRLQLRFSEKNEKAFYEDNDLSSSYVVAVLCAPEEVHLLREVEEGKGALEKEVKYVKGLVTRTPDTYRFRYENSDTDEKSDEAFEYSRFPIRK